jgi:hypothetical protein
MARNVKNPQLKAILGEYCEEDGYILFTRLNEIIEHYYFTKID